MSDNKILPAIILAAGIASGAGLLGAQFKNLRQPGTITVKGLAEAQHNATLGTWRVGVEAWGQDYAAALKANEKNLAVLQGFLKKQGNDGKFPPLPCDSAGGTTAPVLLIFVLVEEEQGI